MATEILNNCQFDLTRISKLYLGNVWENSLLIPLPYKTTTGDTDVIRVEEWASDDSYVYIGGEKLYINEIYSTGDNITFNESMIIDSRAINYKKTISFSLPAITLPLMTDLKTLGLTLENGQYKSPPTIAFLIDENNNQICVGYDYQLFIVGIEKVIGEDNLITFTWESKSKSRARHYVLDPWPSPSVSPTPSITPSISTSPTPSISSTPSASVTPSTTPSASVAPSSTPSVSVTPSISITPSISVSPSTLGAAQIDLENAASADYSIISLYVGSSQFIPTGPDFPLYPGDSTYGTSPEPAGTYTVTIGISGSGTGYNLVFMDSNGIPYCVEVSAAGSYQFSNVVLNNSTICYVILSNGMCS